MSNNIQTFCLNIHLLSFNLPHDLYHESDKIRVGITTLPEHNKSKFVISASKIEHSNHVFDVNVEIPESTVKDLPPNATKKIIVSFRKKTAFSKPMIGTAIIHYSDFPKIGDNKAQQNFDIGKIKKIDIYEPIDQQKKEIKECEEKGMISAFEETDHHTVKRKVIGSMEIQLVLSSPLEEIESIHNKEVHNKHNAHGKLPEHSNHMMHGKHKNNNATSYHHIN